MGPEDGFAELFRVEEDGIDGGSFEVKIVEQDGGEFGDDGGIAQGVGIVEVAFFGGGSLREEKR